MIFAELHHKLGGGSRLDDRVEDVLTSNVFGLFRYVSIERGLIPFLRRAQALRLDSSSASGVAPRPAWLHFENWTRCEVHFWERHHSFGEPDIRIEAFDARGVRVAVFIVEAKYLSKKSGQAEKGAEYDPATPDGDQLTRYWQILEEYNGAIEKGVIYLTAHSSPPGDEIRASLERIPIAPMNLSWLSWQDAWSAARGAQAVGALTWGEAPLPMADLAALLAHKGLKPFTGFSLAHFPLCLSSARVFRKLRWFNQTFQQIATDERLWRHV